MHLIFHKTNYSILLFQKERRINVLKDWQRYHCKYFKIDYRMNYQNNT